MPAKGRGLPEAFSTNLQQDVVCAFFLKIGNLANERSRSSVDGHVPRQVVVGVENLSTVRARIGLVLALHHLQRKIMSY